MSVKTEAGLRERVAESPAFEPGKLRDIRLRDLAIRFAAGALTSVCAALLTLALGSRVGGVLLAFPAILGASLTLIAEEEDGNEARECARGSVLGGVALAVFAVVAALALHGLPGSAALVLASAAWALVALGGYAAFWR